ncbi:MAG: 7-cyano-7-deazaguanine synthase [Candidatus Koribacter versatilis]|uniref:7-cyano-7-deazaguanine synthase n=1 Tax=Candidatus Korobacter versatilis TaxID=658062 RepID=A0A932A7L7_9BACT|nr:7-cyano-7-deazaguanine synthase [Candidatus Koribacter versatilis]
MALVVLSSGGVDSTVISVLASRSGIVTHPLFIDYGQLCSAREWAACQYVHRRLRLPRPRKMDVRGYGALIPSGLTSRNRRIKEDAFLPGRNLLFCLCGAAYAYGLGVQSIALGLLDDSSAIYPDQTRAFVESAEKAIHQAFGYHISVTAPLIEVPKSKVLRIASEMKISGTYSCHAGSKSPCGKCVSCLEFRRSTEGRS